MKKGSLLPMILSLILILSGCTVIRDTHEYGRSDNEGTTISQRTPILGNAPVQEDVRENQNQDCLEDYDARGVSFSYPCDWKVKEESTDAVWIVSPLHVGTVRIPAPTFQEYESLLNKSFGMDFMIEDAEIMLNERRVSGKTYTHHGGVESIFFINGNYVGVWESYDVAKMQDALSVILPSVHLVGSF